MTDTDVEYVVRDCVSIPLETDSVDLVFTSPPYEDARTYGIDYKVKGDDWVQWTADRYMECLRVCRGLVAWVVQGRTRKFEWSATPVLLMAELKRRGVVLRNPPIYHRVGIPGSGGPDWLRSDYEWIICGTRERGKLPWSDNTACGHAPKFPPGGDPSHRMFNGRRVDKIRNKRMKNGTMKTQGYVSPKKVNPGNVVQCHGGGGHLGHALAHENEAPFPLKLAEFFVRSFCPPGGTVLDPMCGSGTTGHAAVLHDRNAYLMDVRADQIELAKRRIDSVKEQQHV